MTALQPTTSTLLPRVASIPQARPIVSTNDDSQRVESGIAVSPDDSLLNREISRFLKTTAIILAVMALGAIIPAVIVFSSPLIGLGFCVALSMMLFIGMPLILASAGDAGERHDA